jgi:putative flippase GtrA
VRALFDSLRLPYVLLRYLMSSLLSALVDNLVFVAAFAATSSILGAQALGRGGSVAFNYWTNRTQVFRSREPGRRALTRYLALVVASGAASYGLIRALVAAGAGVLPAKLAAESLLFFGNFAVQRTRIFPPGRAAASGPSQGRA